MKRKIKFLIALLLTIIFASSLIHIPIINNNNNSTNDQISTFNQPDEDPTKEDPTDLEQLNQLKTADISEEQQNHNFSLNAIIKESWGQTFHFPEINSTGPDNSQTDWMILQNTEGATINNLIFIMYNLMNLTSYEKAHPSNFTTMYLSYYNESMDREIYDVVDDHEVEGVSEGYGKVLYSTPLKINETANAQLVVWNDWVEDTNISFGAFMLIGAYREYNITTRFVPTSENTQSDLITWELNYDGHLNHLKADQNYDATIEIEEFNNFTVGDVLGFDGNYWLPLNYSRNETHISINYLLINNSISEFKIELQTPNFLSIVYNNNLTSESPELRLYATCKIAGNLSIRFKLPNGTIFEESWLVQENYTKFYNYIMPLNATGGVGSLNVTLTDNFKSKFGVKIRDVYFHKKAYFEGYTSNTSAFSDFFIAVGYIDWDTLMYLYYLNQSSPSINWDGAQIQEMATIPNATITYELEDLTGELKLQFLGPWYNAPNISVYWTVVELSEYQIPPGTYNLTFRASKPGYDSLVDVKPIVISEKAVHIEIVLLEDVLTIEEEFVISFNLYDNVTFQNFLMTPVTLNLTFINNDTKLIEEFFPISPVIQSISLPATITNDTLPGTYILNITIDSEYYYGSIERFIEVAKKKLEISLGYDDTVDEDEYFDITWSLENGNFTGNRENMTMNIYVDNSPFRVVNLTATNISSGIITLKLDEGDHTVTYSIVSPFYELERTITIEAEGEESEPEEKSWLEENWPLLLLLILAIIAMSIFGIYMTISRRRVKAQRELESELVALKTKFAATENNIALIQTQISEIAGIYWILVIHSEQGITMVEITEFRFNEVLGEEFKVFVEEGMIRDSALIGGFLTAIRNFSRETSGSSLEYQPIFNSQTDYSTIVNNKEVHRRILEGTNYFMAFISARETMEISEVLESVNSKFHEGYGEAAKEFMGRVTVFDPFKGEVVTYLHNEIRELQKKLEDEILLRQHYERHLKQVQEKIGITKNK